MSTHGGSRPGAGRKAKVEFEALRDLVARAISEETWITILKGVAEEAEYGNTRCVELLIAYRFGITTGHYEKEKSGKPLKAKRLKDDRSKLEELAALPEPTSQNSGA